MTGCDSLCSVVVAAAVAAAVAVAVVAAAAAVAVSGDGGGVVDFDVVDVGVVVHGLIEYIAHFSALRLRFG